MDYKLDYKPDLKRRSYTGNQAKRHTQHPPAYRQKGQELLPSFLFFRIRLITCIVLFIGFIFFYRQIPASGETKEKTTEVFQMMSENADSERWRKVTEPVYSVFSEKKMKEVFELF